MRLIDVDKLTNIMIETLELLKKNPIMDQRESHLIAAFHTVGEMINDAQTIDATPVVHGHWENVQPTGWAGDYGTCSICRKRQTLDKVRNFCSNCGAKMDERN